MCRCNATAVARLAVPNTCTVSGGATRNVSVPSGGTATVSYSVTDLGGIL
jgi:hypothetical protein